MNFITQTIQFQVEVEKELWSAELQEEAERRLVHLIESRNDLFGAKVVMNASRESPSQQQQIFQIQAIVYALSGDIVAVKKANTVRVALRRALDAIEHRVHHQHGTPKELGKRRERHDWRADGFEDGALFTGQNFDARYIEEILAEF